MLSFRNILFCRSVRFIYFFIKCCLNRIWCRFLSSVMAYELLSLKWDNHKSTLLHALPTLREKVNYICVQRSKLKKVFGFIILAVN